jgi:hypothetical protein
MAPIMRIWIYNTPARFAGIAQARNHPRRGHRPGARARVADVGREEFEKTHAGALAAARAGRARELIGTSRFMPIPCWHRL